MSDVPPIVLRYDGEGVFSPASKYWAQLADRHYVIGAEYRLIPHEHRSVNSHNHYFASIADAWQNLPAELAVQFPSPDALRRFALIKAGFCDQHTFVCSSKAEALRLAAFIKPVDEYAVVVAKEATVIRYTAKSQSMKAMGKEEFQRSKDSVLGIVSEMLGTSVKALEGNTGKSGDGTR